MVRKYLRWTMPGGKVENITIWTPADVQNDYSVVYATSSQNRLRHNLSVLQRTNFGGHSVLPGLWDIMVTFDGKEYRIWTYTRNWTGRASFIAGVLVGKNRLWNKVQRRLRRRKRIKM